MAAEQTGHDDSACLPDSMRFIAQFEPLIIKLSRRASFQINGTSNLTEDLAQEVRTHLLRAIGLSEIQNPGAIPETVKNKLLDLVKVEKRRFRLSSVEMLEIGDPKLIRDPKLKGQVSEDKTGERDEILSVSQWILRWTPQSAYGMSSDC